MLIPNTSEEQEWQSFKGHSHMQAWLCVPLIASQRVLGILSLGDTRAHTFTQEHLRLAKSLAIPAAVAIQNARLYERAEIYGVRAEQRLVDLHQIQQALRARRAESHPFRGKIHEALPVEPHRILHHDRGRRPLHRRKR